MRGTEYLSFSTSRFNEDMRMTVDYFTAFGEMPLHTDKTVLFAGRRSALARSEGYIVAEVACKLSMTPGDAILEIGCGAGNILIPLAKTVRKAMGVDHPNLVRIARKRSLGMANVSFAGGKWPEVQLAGTYSKILIYSVIQYLNSPAAVFHFIDSALKIMRPAGMLLLGDLPNADKNRRFMASKNYEIINARYKKRCEKDWESDTAAMRQISAVKNTTVDVNDALILDIVSRYRAAGYNVYILPQGNKLPFCETREDVLICGK